jgi:hypothetical protein
MSSSYAGSLGKTTGQRRVRRSGPAGIELVDRRVGMRLRSVTMGHVTTGKRAAPGRHAGAARPDESAPKRRSANGPMLLLALGITASVVAWGYLVYLAIDLGTAARDGDSRGWFFLVLATIGAIACLFVALMLGMRLVARFRASAPPPEAPRPPGGRRALR